MTIEEKQKRLVELKAAFYDHLVQKEKHEKELMAINQEIARLNSMPLNPPTP